MDGDLDISRRSILEGVNVSLDDSFISSNGCKINGYGLHSDDVAVKPTNPKTDPTRAITITFQIGDSAIQIFFDPNTMTWNSSVDFNGQKTRLTPDQLGKFLTTEFFNSFSDKLSRVWPLEDPYYSRLLDGIKRREVSVFPEQTDQIDEDGEFRSGNIDIERSREKNAAGEQIRTNSGRKIVHFSDFSLTKKSESRYYCWPEKGKEFKFSQWNIANKVFDAEKATPMFVRMSFWHGMYEYGLNLGLRDNISINRGFFSYNLTLQPPVQWCTPTETTDMLTLSNVQHFLRNCKKRINRFLNVDTDEIYERINNPEHITKEMIDDTKHVIRMNFDIVRNPRADTYIYP